MNYRVKNSRGEISANKKPWLEHGDCELFLKRLRVDLCQHPETGEPITASERAEYLAYYMTIIDDD